VRNRLAELILDAFDGAEAHETLRALAAFARSRDGRVGSAPAARLRALGWFAAAGSDAVALRGTHHAHAPTLLERARRAAAMRDALDRVPDATTLAGVLGRAALLADAGLFFEVHELLEPAWLRAEGPRRLGLQALIQVAVAQHHLAGGNHAGAISLLHEGLAKLAASRGALPLDTAAWEPALAVLLAALRSGAPPPALPAWPRPTDAG
jgi:hypothetical protein